MQLAPPAMYYVNEPFVTKPFAFLEELSVLPVSFYSLDDTWKKGERKTNFGQCRRLPCNSMASRDAERTKGNLGSVSADFKELGEQDRSEYII